jgi:ubiquitin-like-conjugating enzyme ATG3
MFGRFFGSFRNLPEQFLPAVVLQAIKITSSIKFAMEEAFRLFKSTREYFTPVLTETAFYEKGILTPEEFVRAGDQLIRACPSWKWEGGEPSKIRQYLPADKQFLSTRGVPSYSRVSVLTSSKVVEDTVKGEMGDAEGDWCAPALLKADDNDTDEVLVEAEDAMDDFDKMDEVTPSKIGGTAASAPVAAAADDEYLDMEDESLALDDATTTQAGKTTATSVATDGVSSGMGHLVRTRRYDVSITYDNYYRTPRFWLFGFDENGSALSTTEVYQVRNKLSTHF